MDVMLIKALDDYYQFDHPVEQSELRDYLQQALHMNEHDAVFALASLIAQDFLRVYQTMRPGTDSLTCAMLRPGPRLLRYHQTCETLL